jgi:hypothetical protein
MNLNSIIEEIAKQALWDGLADGLYGEKHWRRTFLLADAIAKEVPANKEIIGLAALLHDIGRLNHKQDSFHGYRGAAQALRVTANIFAVDFLGGVLPDDFFGRMVILGKIIDIVNRHCLEPHDDDPIELQVVRDANILDRVRFKGRDSIDPQYLALRHVSEGLIDYALEILEDTPEERDAPPKLVTLPGKKLIIPKGTR